jgi:hypothetical protein
MNKVIGEMGKVVGEKNPVCFNYGIILINVSYFYLFPSDINPINL